MSESTAAKRQSTWQYWIGAACLYLAAAPIGQEPHLAGKLRWVMGGAAGMKPIDWLDLMLHGAPILGFGAWQLWQALRKRTLGKGA